MDDIGIGGKFFLVVLLFSPIAAAIELHVLIDEAKATNAHLEVIEKRLAYIGEQLKYGPGRR